MNSLLMYRVIFSVLLIVSFFYTQAQTDFRPGYVITNSMDTIHGLIDYRGDVRNMRVCTFKKSQNDLPKKYLPGEIYAYRYNSGKYYMSKEIKRGNDNEMVFLEFLLSGIYKLYYHVSFKHNAYYIESDKGEMIELKRNDENVEVIRDGQAYVKKDYQYKGLLAYAFSDFPEIQKEVVDTELNHKSLISITKKYHDYKCTDESCIIYEKKLPILSIELKPLMGYSFTFLSFKNYKPADIDFQMSYGPLVGVASNLKLPRLNEKMSLLFSFTLNEDYFYASTIRNLHQNSKEYSYYHINNTNFTGCIAFKYTYPKGRYRPELFAGVYGNNILKSDSKIFVETLVNKVVQTQELEPHLFDDFQKGFVCGAGLEYKLFNKLTSFSNLTFLYGSNTQSSDIELLSNSFRVCTGLIF